MRCRTRRERGSVVTALHERKSNAAPGLLSLQPEARVPRLPGREAASMPRERPRQSKRVQSAVKCLVGEDRQIKDYDAIVARKGATACPATSGVNHGICIGNS